MPVHALLYDSSSWFGDFTPLRLQQLVVGVVGVLALIGLVLAFLRMRRRIAYNRTVEKARSHADIALRTIRSRLNYSIQLLNNERDMAKYDKVRFKDSDATFILSQLQHAEQQYSQVQSALDRAIQQLPEQPSDTEYQALAEFITTLLPAIPTVERTIQEAIQHRSKTENIIQTQSAHIDQAKHHLQQLIQRFQQLGIATKQIVRTPETDIEHAQALLARHEYDDILAICQRTEAYITHVNHLLDLLHDIRNGIGVARKAAEKAAVQGFEVSQSLAYTTEATKHADEALEALIAGLPDNCEHSLRHAELARNNAVAYGGNLPAIQQRNADALNQHLGRIEHMPTLIKTAHQAVHGMTTYADHHWIDTRQAGSEALIHLRYAHAYLHAAQHTNHTSPQNHALVSTYIDIGHRSLKRTERLLNVIQQRVQSLNAIADIARAEFSDAEELMDRLQIHVTTDSTFNNHAYDQMREAYDRIQIVADTIPFDAIVCFHVSRNFVDQITRILPVETSELTISASQRVGRLRGMLVHHMAVLEQSHTLMPRRIPSAIAQGLQSIRHEVNAFDAKYRTASDVTIPMVTELDTLTKQYTRLITAIQHFHAQLIDYHAQTLRDVQQVHDGINTIIQHHWSTATTTARTQLLDVDQQWYERKLSTTDALTQMTQIMQNDEPATNPDTTILAPYLSMRAWGRAYDSTPTEEVSWSHTEPLSLHW